MAAHHTCVLRKGRTSLQNQIYLVTTVTKNRQPLFTSFSKARFVVNSLKYVEFNRSLESLCFVIMPDHLHWLFSLKTSTSLSQVVADVKRRSGYRINQNHKQTGTAIWQPGFHDYALRDESEIKDIARYIVANPLRAGLVSKVGDYPFWDAVWL